MDRSEILLRFEQWLDSAMTEEGPPQGIPAEILAKVVAGDGAPNVTADGAGSNAAENPPTDWYSMWAAVTALTQEVKLQGRAFKQLNESLAADAERRGRKESLGALLEIRERLMRGIEGVRAGAGVGSLEESRPGFWDRVFARVFARRQRDIQHALSVVRALEDGYRLSMSYLDDHLFQFQVQPIECQGRPFDPRRMNAVDAEETHRVPEGTVVFVYRAGYEWNGELYRPAQVRVARRPGGGGVQ